MLTVIDANVAVDIKETQSFSARSDSTLSQSLTELGGASCRSQAGQFAAQSFYLRRTIQSQDPPQILGRMFFESFGAFDAPERHQQQRQ